jgi:hypothetical protein
MKKNVAVGILRAWIVFGIIFVPVVSLYILYGRPGEAAVIFFVFGSIVVAGGFFLVRWVLASFTKNDDE